MLLKHLLLLPDKRLDCLELLSVSSLGSKAGLFIIALIPCIHHPDQYYTVSAVYWFAFDLLSLLDLRLMLYLLSAKEVDTSVLSCSSSLLASVFVIPLRFSFWCFYFCCFEHETQWLYLKHFKLTMHEQCVLAKPPCD